MIILGIDQGLANIGYAVLSTDDGVRIVESGIIQTEKDPIFGRRLLLIKEKLLNVIEMYCPDLICTENLFCNKPQKAGRNKSAAIVQTNMATAVIFMLGAEYNIPIQQFVPISVKKKIAGSGKASKEEVEEAVKNIFGDEIDFKKDHESDAVAIALTGHFAAIEGSLSCYEDDEDKPIQSKGKAKIRIHKKSKKKGG